MRKFLIPLATAITALLSQQSLASDVQSPDKNSLSNPPAETINKTNTIISLKSTLSKAASNLVLVKAKANLVRTGHSSHHSHRSHRSGR